MAIKNIYDTQDALKEKIEGLENNEKNIRDEKEKYKSLASSFKGLFPNGRRAEDKTRSFLKGLKNLNTDAYAQKPVVQTQKKSKSNALKYLVVGGLVAAIGVALGITISRGSRSKTTIVEKSDGNFARFITNYIKDRE
jgi:hypothetical protein